MFFKIALFFVPCLVIVSAQEAGESLRQVSVFFRHGPRTPQWRARYPNDPYGNETFRKYGWGQLTDLGKERSFNVGKDLRRRYRTFINATYEPGLVRSVTTDYDRTKTTMLLVLAGLFASDPNQKWDDSVGWTPIPYEYDKYDSDFILRMARFYCPLYMRELERMENSQPIQIYKRSIDSVFKLVERNSGKPMQRFFDLFDMWNTLSAEDWMGLKLPDWTENVYPDVLQDFALRMFEIQNSNKVLRRLSGGRSLQQVILNMNNVMNASTRNMPQTKMYLYSGHDYNVYNILSAMKIADIPYPMYNWATILELHRLNWNNYYVKVLLQEGPGQEPRTLKLPGCAELCDYDSFVKITREFVPVNYTAECQSTVNLDDKRRFAENN